MLTIFNPIDTTFLIDLCSNYPFLFIINNIDKKKIRFFERVGNKY